MFCVGGSEANATIPPSPNDDSRLFFGYHIGHKTQVPSKHIVIVNWGHHASKCSAEVCAKALNDLFTSQNVSHPTFCRVCASKTCVSFATIEAATLAFQLLHSKLSLTALKRKILCAYSKSEIIVREETLPKSAINWSTYLEKAIKTKSSATSTTCTTSTTGTTSSRAPVENNTTDAIPYVPGLKLVLDAIDVQEEQILVKEIHKQGEISTNGWNSCARKEARESSNFAINDHRRVMHFGHKFDYDTRGVGDRVTGGCLPTFIQTLAERIREYCGKNQNGEDVFDQCTINEYKAGHGIAAHVDTHSAFGTVLVSLSLLNPYVMSFVHSIDGRRVDLVLPPRSLLILKNEARYIWTHQIPPRSTDVIENGIRVQRDTRLSLTLRRLRKKEEGGCKCVYGGLWCDSLNNGTNKKKSPGQEKHDSQKDAKRQKK
tara:strand:- start:492 stop:1784 length:1293 start_codon:yes stop_codon:yes gene_type:complete